MKVLYPPSPQHTHTTQDQPYLFDRLAPETGQAGRNSFLDDGDTSPINLDGDEAKNSCSSEDTGNGVTCSGEQEQER